MISKHDLGSWLKNTGNSKNDFFNNNLGNLNIDWIIGVKKELWSVLLGVIMALWLCIKTSFGGMHAEVFVHKFVQCLQFDLKCSTSPPTHTPPKMWRQDRWNKYGKMWWLVSSWGFYMSLEIFILQVFACMSVSDVDLSGGAVLSWVLEEGLEPPEKDLWRGCCQVLPSSLPASLPP